MPHSAETPVALTVLPRDAGERLDRFLARRFPERSRAYFQRCLRDGHVLHNGSAARPSETVRRGDSVTISWPPEPHFELRAEDIPLDILAEDDDLLVISKPAGLVVHPAKGNWSGTLVQALLAHSEEDFTAMSGEEMRPGIVHRLDKDTSGVMVIAKHNAAREALCQAFHERRVEKTYLALVLGTFQVQTGEIRAAVGRHPRERKKMAVLKSGGKPAETHYRVLGSSGNVSLVEVRILTGRTHQIRVHFAHLQHPVLGDPVYGGRQRGLACAPQRQMLHAWKLVLPHPRTGLRVAFTAPLPADFAEVLQCLGLPTPESPTVPR